MIGDYFIENQNGQRLGRVTFFRGEPTANKWVAFSTATNEQPKFRTKRDAVSWLARVALEAAKKEAKR